MEVPHISYEYSQRNLLKEKHCFFLYLSKMDIEGIASILLKKDIYNKIKPKLSISVFFYVF